MVAPDIPADMRAAVLTGPGRLQVDQRPVPVPRDDEVLIRVATVGVCGSDVHYYRHGRIGSYVVDQPLVLGHEAAGRIAAVGRDVDTARLGQRVSIEPQRPCRRCRECLSGRYNLCADMRFFATPPVDGAFCEYVLIQDGFAHGVRDALSDDAAALLEPLSVAIAAVRKASVSPGSRVLVAGAGPVGLLTAQTARAFGAAEVLVSEAAAARRDAAVRFGATTTFDPAVDSLDGVQVDAFVDCSGAAAAIQAGLSAVRPAGAVVLVGMGPDMVALPLQTIQNLELAVTGVFRYAHTWPLAEHLAGTKEVDLDGLVTGHFDLDHVAAALEADGVPGSLKAVVTP